MNNFERGVNPKKAMSTGKYSVTPTKVRCKKNIYHEEYHKLAFQKGQIYSFIEGAIVDSYMVADIYGIHRTFIKTRRFPTIDIKYFEEFFEIIYTFEK